MNFCLFKPAWMRNETNIDALPLGQKPWHVLAAKTIPYTTDTADVEVLVNVVDSKAEDAVNFGWRMTRAPFSKVQSWTFAIVGGYSVASE